MKTTIGILAVVLFVAFGFQSNAQNPKRNSCINGISNLTEVQKASITALETSFQKQMTDYRSERQSTTDLEIKTAIREKMTTARADHRQQVSDLLTTDQQKEYAVWQSARNAQGNNGNAIGRSGKKGTGKGKGNGQGLQGKGRGACIVNN